MTVSRLVLVALMTMGLFAVQGQAQDPSDNLPSSDDLTVAEGLQLPTFGHIWALDTWKGLPELVQLHPSDPAKEHFLTLGSSHEIAVKGEAARIRIHAVPIQIFLRSAPADGGADPSNFVLIRLNSVGEHREASKAACNELSAIRKGKLKGPSDDVILLDGQRIATTNWYRFRPMSSVEPGEYALVPLPHTAAAAAGELYDFAIDRDAPENRQALRSEANQRPE